MYSWATNVYHGFKSTLRSGPDSQIDIEEDVCTDKIDLIAVNIAPYNHEVKDVAIEKSSTVKENGVD